MANVDTVICGGCRERVDRIISEVAVLPIMDEDCYQPDRESRHEPVIYFCTPSCLYDYAKATLERSVDGFVEPDLLLVVAQDIFNVLDGNPGNIDEVAECWARLGHVLGQLNLRPE